MSILPINISFTNWAANLRNEYPDSEFPIVTSDSDWKTFAKRLIIIPSFNNVALPDPRGFAAWRDWAIRLTEIIGA